MHTPLITGSDCEGAGEMFQVTTLDMKNPPMTEEGAVDYSQDFFGKETNLTVSGQLNGETYAQAFRNIYTFGPTFRAENSNTTRHAAEFWMIEPECAFADLNDNMDLAEAMLPGCKMPEIGIRPGEKLHEIMVTVEDSATTYEYDKHFIVYPQVTWNEKQKINTNGKKVQEGFSYSSGNNTEWLSVEQIRELLKTVELEK